MMAWWATWWAWGIAALVFAFIEVLLPSYVFFGFAIGAALTGGLLWLNLGVFAGPTGSPEMLMLTFGIFSLVAWIGLRRYFGVRAGQVKMFDRDINED